jgi:hypothetical protein
MRPALNGEPVICPLRKPALKSVHHCSGRTSSTTTSPSAEKWLKENDTRLKNES